VLGKLSRAKILPVVASASGHVSTGAKVGPWYICEHATIFSEFALRRSYNNTVSRYSTHFSQVHVSVVLCLFSFFSILRFSLR